VGADISSPSAEHSELGDSPGLGVEDCSELSKGLYFRSLALPGRQIPANRRRHEEIDEAVLQLVKDCGKKLTKTIETNNHGPPPGPGVPPAQVILNPILLPLNAPPQCQWSMATAVPNTGPVVQNAPQANAPGPAQNVPASPANPQVHHNPPPAAPAIPQAQNNGPGPVIIPAQIQAAHPMGILGRPLGMQHAPPANPQVQNNPPPPGPAFPQTQNNPAGAANPPGQNNLLGARTPCKDLQGKVTLPCHTPTSKEKDNTPLQPRHWDGASSPAAWVVASQHQRPLSTKHIL